MSKIVRIVLLYLISMFLLPCALAAHEGGFGGVAQNLMEPVSLFSDFIQTGCFLIGASFLFASIIKYIEHRRSPLMVPISTVVFLFIAGIILVLLPFLAYFTSSGIPYSLSTKR